MTRIIGPRRSPRRRWTFLSALILALAVGAIWVIPGLGQVLGDGPGPCNVQVTSGSDYRTCNQTANGSRTGATEKGAIIEYIGDSSADGALGSSGTGVFDPFLRIQGTPSEQGFNTDGPVQFDTKTGTWTHAEKVSSIPVIFKNGVHYWELFVDVNDSNSGPQIALNKLEIYFTSNAMLTGYPFPSSSATQEYSYSGQVQVNDVNQGSGRGDLRVLIPLDGPNGTITIPAGCDYNPNPNAPCSTYFVLYSQWGAPPAAANFASDGGFEEWQVHILPSVHILKTANPASPVSAGNNIGFDINVSNTSPATATNVTITDPLPAGQGGDLNWSLSPAFSGCSITGAVGSQNLNCSFASLAGNASIGPIHITSPTTKADCAVVSNTATVATGNDGGGSSTASVTVQCGALVIKKESTKSGNPLVKNPGAVFSVTGPGGYSASVKDNNNPAGTASDEDSTVGQVCISGLAPGTYTVNETSPPAGYGSATQTNVTGTVMAGTDCGTNEPTSAAAVFTDPPLYDFQVNFKDDGSGETNATISCSPGEPPDSTTAPAPYTTSKTYTNRHAFGDITCTIHVDP